MNIVLFGGGSQLSYTIDILNYYPEYNIVGVIDSVKEIGSIHFGIKIIGRQENLIELIKEYKIEGGLISIGDNFVRNQIFSYIIRQVPHFKFINAIHPSAVISKSAKLSLGITIMAGCIVNSGASLGNSVFLATGAQIEHDCKLHGFSSVSAGAIMGGFVEIGLCTAITLGVIIVDRVKIGNFNVVGAGSLVLKSIEEESVLVYGSPAKIIRKRSIDEKYLK
jgi:sugar O-acyltransferase (sialic acid O-acetyltransferase NeuD family)